MNTREREVMDAAAELCRFIVGGLDIPVGLRHVANDLMKRIDALLAEGSASGEGAEAVAPYVPDDQWSELLNPQPAQGEHERRSSEGSERRQSAIENAFYEAQGDIFTTETPWGEVSAWIAARAKEQCDTAERRPSCGQDARDAPDVCGHCGAIGGGHTLACQAIAAQQRQGGEK